MKQLDKEMSINIKFAYAAIVVSVVYFVVAIGFVLTETDIFLVYMEIMTILSALALAFLVFAILDKVDEDKKLWKYCAGSFITCMILLTSAGHFINLVVINQLETTGVVIPEYLQIRKWPSIILAVDYLAWGLFLGFTFLSTALALCLKNGRGHGLKWSLVISGSLCLLGLSGPILNNQNLWFISVTGYAIGTPVISLLFIDLLRRK